MRVTLDVVGDQEHEFDVEDATYGDLLAEVGLSPNEVAVIVDGRPVPEDQPAEPGRARVLRLVSGGRLSTDRGVIAFSQPRRRRKSSAASVPTRR